MTTALDTVTAAARKATYLSAEEESELARRWRDNRDGRAVTKLIESHARLAIAMARPFCRYNIPLEDLVQEAKTGLVRAAEKFEPDRGVRFSTYARWWMRAALQEYVVRNFSMVRISASGTQKMLFFQYARARRELDPSFEGDEAAADREIARLFGITEKEVAIVRARLSGQDQSLNAPMRREEGSGEIQDGLVSNDAPLDEVVLEAIQRERRLEWLGGILQGMNARDREILERRYLSTEPATLDDLAQAFGVSRERIRQIEQRALSVLVAAGREWIDRIGRGGIEAERPASMLAPA